MISIDKPTVVLDCWECRWYDWSCSDQH